MNFHVSFYHLSHYIQSLSPLAYLGQDHGSQMILSSPNTRFYQERLDYASPIDMTSTYVDLSNKLTIFPISCYPIYR